MAMPTLPLDWIVEIIINLPVKSLLRFRCVCKSLDSIISSSQFSKLLSKQARLYLGPCLSSSEYAVINLNEALLAKGDNFLSVVEFPWKGVRRNTTLTQGSCDGLIVCSLWQPNHVYYLWNPSTRDFRMLPPADCCFGIYKIDREIFVHCGFGYDKSEGDYKLVRLVSLDGRRTDVEVLTLKTGKWRRKTYLCTNFETSRSHFVARTYGIFSNNALHWIGRYADNRHKGCVVVAFDLSKEEFQLLPTPDQCGDQRYHAVDVLGDCLFLLCNDCPIDCRYGCLDKDREVWMMKEYGDKASWIKLITIPYALIKLSCFVPFRFLGTDEILAVAGGNVLRCNIKNQSFECVVSIHDWAFGDACLYMESLISPAELINEEILGTEIISNSTCKGLCLSNLPKWSSLIN